MAKGKVLLTTSVALGMLVASFWSPRGPSTTAAPADTAPRDQDVSLPAGAIGLEIRLGRGDATARAWDGRIEVTAGRVVALEVESGRGSIDPADLSRWQVRTDQPVAKAKAKANANAKAKAKAKAGPRTTPVTLLATLDAPGDARVAIYTTQGAFTVALRELVPGQPREYLNGAASIERVAATRPITAGGTDDDFPAAAVANDGTVWCAFVAYRHGNPIDSDAVAHGRFDSLEIRDHGDQVLLRSYKNGIWSARAVEVSDNGLDVWRPSIAVDRTGVVWIVWSQQEQGDWDLHARSYDPKTGKLGTIERLTRTKGPDINAVCAAAREGQGEIWIAWQAWRDENFEILLNRIGPDGRAGTPERVSTSKANDWSPAIAAGPLGEIWVAWDTYDRGNYDVLARRRSPTGGFESVIPIAASPRFEARPSLALDRQSRLWVAYEDADPEWGKDFGTRYKGRQGVPLYLERTILVRCVEQGRLRARAQIEPAVLQTHSDDPTMPLGPHRRVSFPRIAFDGHGTLWMLYRRHKTIETNGELWVSFATRFDGSTWSPALALRRSENLLDNRPALALTPAGSLVLIHSSDDRTAGSPSARVNHLHASLLTQDQAAEEPSLVAVTAETPSVADNAVKEIAPIHPDEAAQVERMRTTRIEAAGKTYRLLRGDFHRHTELSAHRDWDGPMEDFWRYGIDVAAQDWIGPTDHEYAVGLEYMWYLTQKQIDLYHLGSKFVTMFTYERSLPYPSGHRNVMFSRRGCAR